MVGSGRLCLWRVLVAVLAVAACAAQDCSSAGNATCGHGACEGYIFINGVCTSICSFGTYYDANSSMCLSCLPLGPVSCSALCPAFFFAPGGGNSTNSTNSTNGTGSSSCQPCAGSYGLTCTGCTASECTRCAPGHTLAANGQSCVATHCNISKCVLCSGPSGCYLCEPGWVVSTAGDSCVAVGCQVSYCSLCSGSSCQACIEGYHLSGNVCRPICDAHCRSCLSPSVCGQCDSGYALDAAFSCHLNCSSGFDGHCVACDSLLYCTTCEEGYVSALGGAICQPVFQCSDPHCSSCSIASLCTVCNTGYYLSAGRCVRDICFISNCLRCASVSTCETCARDYALDSDNTSCVPSCVAAVPHCLVCNSSSSCHVCDLGYFLQGGQCVKLCNITDCALCLTSSACLICEDGLLASQDFSTCEMVCGDPNCYACNTSSSCLTCVSGFAVGENGICVPRCRRGSAADAHGVCQQCKHSLSNCQACAFDSANAISCTDCTAGYYLSSGNCFSCPAAIAHCRLCSAPSACQQCTRGYVIFNGTCVSQDCDAKNCLICQGNSTSLCSTCAAGFEADSSGNCKVKCSAGMILANGVCSCPLGTFLGQTGGACQSCSDSNCLVCSVSACSQCTMGFYASGPNCLRCIDNCRVCSDSKTCNFCEPPYVFTGSACQTVCNGCSGGVTPGGNVFTCDPGCSVCAKTPQNVMVCLTVLDGYSQVGGNIIKCDQSCMTCNGPASTDCLSCFAGNALSSGDCLNCTDSHALTCAATDPSFSLTCVKGFTAVLNTADSPSTSTCKLCAANCYRCDAGGEGTCDAGQCELGYVQQPGNTNCTQCFGGCSSCDPANLMNCLSCGPRRYTDPTTGDCAGCPTGCQNCNSSAVCTSCFPNFMMVGTLCQPTPTWPCVAAQGGVCTGCVENFAVVGGACEYSSNCSATASCANCPYGYYLTNLTSSLQGICAACPSLAHCLTCDPATPADCFLCRPGFYLSRSGDCLPCAKGCAQCLSGEFCTQAEPGYYLVSGADGTPSGIAGVCASPCLTCEVSPYFCLSCMEGYGINGASCFSRKVAYYTMVFSLSQVFGENDTFEVAYGKIINNIGFFRTTICRNLPKTILARDPTCRTNFHFLRFAPGSVSSTIALDIADYPSTAAATDDLSASNLIPGATVFSTSVSTPGSESGSGTNLGLILGVSIPLGLLVLVIIAIIIYAKNSEANEKEAEESGKPIEYDDMEDRARPPAAYQDERVDRL